MEQNNIQITQHNTRPIAILLAAYNAEMYLEQQINSILCQTNQDWTLYIRDDKSTDNTLILIEKYTNQYPDKIIQIDTGGENLGCRANFFRLFETIESLYYMFCDADDEWYSHKVQTLFEAIQDLEKQYPSLPLQAFADTTVCDENMNIIEYSHWKNTGINPEKFLSYNYMAVCCNAGGACSIYNHKVKELIFPLKNDFLIYDFWIAINVAKHGKFKVIHQPLIKYRQHRNQVYGIKYGKQNSLKYKFKNILKLIKQYHWEAQHHTDFGYGPHIKYYWFKLLTILKIRLSRY
ncbi:glycosyltransferase [Parabacteroides sp. APC149_11_2_Y6]